MSHTIALARAGKELEGHRRGRATNTVDLYRSNNSIGIVRRVQMDLSVTYDRYRGR